MRLQRACGCRLKKPRRSGARTGSNDGLKSVFNPVADRGSSRSRNDRLFQIAQSSDQADRVVDQRTAMELNVDVAGAPRRALALDMCGDGAAHQRRSRRLDSAAPGKRPVIDLFIGGSAAVPVPLACRWSWVHSPGSTSWHCGHICGLGHSSVRPSWCS